MTEESDFPSGAPEAGRVDVDLYFIDIRDGELAQSYDLPPGVYALLSPLTPQQIEDLPDDAFFIVYNYIYSIAADSYFPDKGGSRWVPPSGLKLLDMGK